ncbi:MAG: CBS domain-containing protein [Pseudomonadota bacterium]
MGVPEILASKGHDVVTTNPDATIHEVAQLMAKNQIGAVVMTDAKGNMCGITSERDIVRQIAEKGVDALGQPVSDCMTKKVVFSGLEETIDSLMDKMTKGRFRHLPIIDNDKLCGIISVGDVVKRKIDSVEQDADEMKRYISG